MLRLSSQLNSIAFSYSTVGKKLMESCVAATSENRFMLTTTTRMVKHILFERVKGGYYRTQNIAQPMLLSSFVGMSCRSFVLFVTFFFGWFFVFFDFFDFFF